MVLTGRYILTQKDGKLIQKPLEEAVKPERCRNQILNDLLFLADYNYANYRNAIYKGRAGSRTVFDVLGLGLSGAGTVASGQTDKTVFAALSAFVQGTALSIDRNFFADQATFTILERSDVLMREKRAEIEGKLSRSIIDYTMTEALGDVFEYYTAGTIPSAIASIDRENARIDERLERRNSLLRIALLKDKNKLAEAEAEARALTDASLREEALKLLGSRSGETENGEGDTNSHEEADDDPPANTTQKDPTTQTNSDSTADSGTSKADD